MDNQTGSPGAKRVADSHTEQVQIIMPEHINGERRLFGGKLVEWVDVVAAVVARRHSGQNVTTAAIDSLEFHAAAYVNDTLVLVGEMTHVGRTSMEVRVDTFVENLAGVRHLVNRAYLVMVALDKDQNPAPVPGLLPETQEEKAEWRNGELRRTLRKERRSQGL